MCSSVYVVLFALLAYIYAHPKSSSLADGSTSNSDRVIYEHELSDKEHFPNQHHDSKYDHEAFLGEDAKTFDQLTPEESKRRLGLLVDKIDNNGDGFVSREELKDWIRYKQRQYVRDDVVKQWKQFTPQNESIVSWDNYQKYVYGFLDAMQGKMEDVVEYNSYKAMMARDRRRWTAADRNGDDLLIQNEFADFLHPQESEHMRDIVVQEMLEEIDKDGDGKVSLKEYIGDMYRGDGEELAAAGKDELGATLDGGGSTNEPEWVDNERQQFRTYRDKDGDGFMDMEEVRNWILPPDFDHAEAEARHLVYEADSDADEQLTKDEILNKFDLFVGSQATDFGDALNKHDEF